MMEILNAKVRMYRTMCIDIDAEIDDQDGELFFCLGKGRQTSSGHGFIYELKEGVDLWLWNR